MARERGSHWAQLSSAGLLLRHDQGRQQRDLGLDAGALPERDERARKDKTDEGAGTRAIDFF